MTIHQVHEAHNGYDTIEEVESRLDKHFKYRFIQSKMAFLRYQTDQKELKDLKKLGIVKYLDEIIKSGSVDKVSLQCLTKIRSREKRIASYPEIYRQMWNHPEVKELESLSPIEAEKKMQELRIEIRALDQECEARHVQRTVRSIEGKRSVSFSENQDTYLYLPEKGNYESLKLRVRKIENTQDSEKKIKLLGTIIREMEETIGMEAILEEPGYKSLYLKVSSVIETLSGESG